MTKNCTNLEQSKKFIELGIDLNTADMCISLFTITTNGNKEIKQVLLPLNYSKVTEYPAPDFIERFPAWSLSALLGLMPTDDKKDEYYVDTESHSDYHTVSYRNCWDGCIHSEYSKESLLDGAFEMIVWLKENGKI